MGAGGWKDSAATLSQSGKAEVDHAKRNQAIEAIIDRTAGTVKS